MSEGIPPANTELEAVINQASHLRYTGKPAEALVIFDKIIAEHPHALRAHTGKALSLAELGRGEEALAAVNTAIQLDPTYGVAYTIQGLALHVLGRVAEAEASFIKAIEVSPENPRVLYNFACFWARRGDVSKCREYLSRSFQYLDSRVIDDSKTDRDLKPYADTPWYHELHEAARTLEEGIARFRAGEYEAAIAAFDAVITLNPHHARAQAGLAHALVQLGRTEDALAAADAAIAINPYYIRGYAARALCLQRLRRNDEALEVFRYAEQIAPEDPDILYNFACFWAGLRKEADCRRYLERAADGGSLAVATLAVKDPDLARYAGKEWFREAVAEAKIKSKTATETRF